MNITSEGLQKLQQELKYLESKKLPQAKHLLKLAVDEGDGPHDNVLWRDADAEFQRICFRISKLKDLIKESIVSDNKSRGLKIGIKVKIKLRSGVTREFEIVHPENVNPRENKISLESPVLKDKLS